MKNNAFIVVSFLILFRLSVVAQDLTYSKVFYDIEGGVQAYSMVESFDHNYMIVGQKDYSGLIIKMDPLGNIIWARSHSEYDVIYNNIIVTSDSCFVLAGYYINQVNYEYDVICTKLNQDGDTMWSRIIDAGINEVALSVNENDDHGYILTGYTSDYPNPDKIFTARLNYDGNLVWIITELGDNDFNCAYSAKQIPDGGFIVTGYAANASTLAGACLIKLTPDGTVEWFKKLEIPDCLSSIGFDILISQDGLLCYAMTGNNDFIILKTDFLGNINATKSYHSVAGFDGYINVPMPKLRPASDGGYVCVTPGQGGTLIRLDEQGNLVFIKELFLMPIDVLESADKGYLIAGNGPLIGSDKVLNPQIGIIKTDSLGTGTECVYTKYLNQSNINANFITLSSTGINGGGQQPFYPEVSDVELTTIYGCVDFIGGAEENILQEEMIYPNPTERFITINMGSRNDISLWNLDIINNMGQKIYSVTESFLPMTIDLGNKSKGLYLLVLRNETDASVRKILVR
jgi:hypothetical protein